jgi:hypothetical protein
MTNTNEQLQALHNAANVLLGTASKIEKEQAKAGGALQNAVVAIVQGNLLEDTVIFDMLDKDGNITETVKAFASDYDTTFRNEDGTEARAKKSAFRTRLMLQHWGVTDNKESKAHNSLWTTAKLAYRIAATLVGESMEVAIVDGKIKASGGNGSERALALAAAKNVAGLASVTKSKGTDNKSKAPASAPVAANSNVVDLDKALRTVAAYATAVAGNKEAPSPTRLSFLKAIIRDASKAIAEMEAE